jgi:DNA anti-recombination protein RmuC
MQSVGELLESLSVALAKAQGVGKGLKSAAEHFSDFTRSINKRVLSRAHKLTRLGVVPAKGKELPMAIPGIAVLEEGNMLELEADDEDDGAEKLVLLTGSKG